jgi:hypothetical protein
MHPLKKLYHWFFCIKTNPYMKYAHADLLDRSYTPYYNVHDTN